MAKNKIPKNRSLNEMMAGIKEEITFENTAWDDEETGKRPVVNRAGKKQTAADFRAQFFTLIYRKRSEISCWILKWPIIKMA